MCSGCGREFSTKQHLDMHVLTSSGCSGDFKLVYPCKICSTMFTRKDNLRAHLRGSHIYPQQPTKSNRAATLKRKKKKKIYSCHFCLKAFGGSCLLTIHLKSHSGNKPFECPGILLFHYSGKFVLFILRHSV